jgi:hypothetical protein
MGQAEIFKWLAKQRFLGVNDYFSIKELTRQMNLEGLRPSKVRFCVSRLVDFGFLDTDDCWPKRFRAKLKIVNSMQMKERQMLVV